MSAETDMLTLVADKGGIAVVSAMALTLMYRLFATHLKENTKALNSLRDILNRLEGKLSS